MRIIISPAKKMRTDHDELAYRQLPMFMQETELLLSLLKELNYDEAKALWNCNDALAAQNYERVQRMNLTGAITPALFAYEGIQYQYMAPGVLQMEELEYLQEHLRILSGFYGMVRPFDGVAPYRLEMQAKLGGPGFRTLYEFWGRKLADELLKDSRCIVNLASKEYSKCIMPYLTKDVQFVTCVFGQKIGGKVIEKATLVKMARGEMVRYMAERQMKSVKELRGFDRMNFSFAEELSNDGTYVFIQRVEAAEPGEVVEW